MISYTDLSNSWTKNMASRQNGGRNYFFSLITRWKVSVANQLGTIESPNMIIHRNVTFPKNANKNTNYATQQTATLAFKIIAFIAFENSFFDYFAQKMGYLRKT